MSGRKPEGVRLGFGSPKEPEGVRLGVAVHGLELFVL